MSKVILITGGSSGIGKAIATYLSKNNSYIVYGSSRDLKKLENVSFLPIKGSLYPNLSYISIPMSTSTP